MKSIIKSFMLLLVAIALFAVASFVYMHAPRLAAGPAAATTAALAYATTTVHEETALYAIDVAYPHFGIAGLDREIASSTNGMIAAFKGSATVAPSSVPTDKNSLQIEIQSVYHEPGLVSVVLQGDAYTGGAHGMPYLETYNFNTKTNRFVTLDDALRMIGMTLPQVSQKTLAELSAQFKEQGFGDALFSEGAQATPENYSVFRIGTSSVTFMFQPYQVAPYAAGEPEVSFPRMQ